MVEKGEGVFGNIGIKKKKLERYFSSKIISCKKWRKLRHGKGETIWHISVIRCVLFLNEENVHCGVDINLILFMVCRTA